MARYALGLDSSTQSLSALVIDPDAGRVIADRSIQFDDAFPDYGTDHGVLRDPDDPRIVHSPPAMWAAALDRILGELSQGGVPPAEIRAVSGSGQQHGSVYLGRGAMAALGRLDPARGPEDQVNPLLSRPTSPIWMDSSTTRECEEIQAAFGEPTRLAEATGSIAFERFTGPQIRKFVRESPEAYERTERIHLVSSFLCSLLIGGDAPIDPGDGAGMNLMDIRNRVWHPAALAATAPGLAERLPSIRPSDSVAGPISDYFVSRHRFRPGTRVVTWSGDNPNSLVGVGLVRSGAVAISLGTSDTLFGFMPDLRTDPRGEGHVFGSPTGHYMSLICFKNGSLARENVRDRFRLDWDAFSEILGRSPAGNRGKVLLPWFDPEIVPKVLQPGPRRYGLPEDDAEGWVRGVVESQMLSMRSHSRWMGVDISSIRATGGASANRRILQVAADVFGAEVAPLRIGNSAALGAAMRAARWVADAEAPAFRWDDLVERFASPSPAESVRPRPETRALYDAMLPVYEACEAHALGEGADPERIRAAFARRHSGR